MTFQQRLHNAVLALAEQGPTPEPFYEDEQVGEDLDTPAEEVL